MNAIHRQLCRSDYWANLAHSQLLPWALRGVPLDGEVLEIGPGYGVTTRWLAERAGPLTAIEIDPELVAELRAEFAGRVEVRRGDGAALPFADASFDTVVCFTMLHHVPSAQQQDRLFAEAARVLRPGGVLAVYDVMLLGGDVEVYPLPWATTAQTSFPQPPLAYSDSMGQAGLEVDREAKTLTEGIEFLERALNGQGPVGVDRAALANLMEAFRAGLLAPVEIYAHRAG